MPRKHHGNQEQGKPYASEWPEWHVDCAEAGCDEHIIMVEQGGAFNMREAEKMFLNNGAAGWTRHKGLWYCPAHKIGTQPRRPATGGNP